MDRPYRTVRELIHIHAGRPAVVLGGGMSLPVELPSCPSRDEAIYLSANDHGARLVEVDYIVAHDNIDDRIRPFGKPLISRYLWADYRYLRWPAPSTGVITAWIARLMGCAPIYIVGMDCFSGKGTYYDKPDEKSAGFLVSVDVHVERWRKMMTDFPAEYRPVGGPVAEGYARWGCHVPGVVPRERIDQDIAGSWVRFKQPVTLKQQRTFRADERVELAPHEAARLIQQGLAEAA